MNIAKTAGLIDIVYDLYAKVGTRLLPVKDPTDLAIKTTLCLADTNRRVATVGSVDEQNAELHAHVLTVSFDLPVLDHTIDFAWKPSRYDPESGTWVKLLSGGAIYYPVVKGNALARLFLAVATIDARSATKADSVGGDEEDGGFVGAKK